MKYAYKGVLSVDLIKNSRKSLARQEENNQGLSLYSFGYYDTVCLQEIVRPSDFYQLLSKTRVDVERVVLVPCQEYEDHTVNWQNIAFGVISFIIVNEKSEAQIWEYGTILGDYINKKESINSIPYYSTGASAIAVITAFKDPDKVVDDMADYFLAVEHFLSDKKECIYSFSTVLMNPHASFESKKKLPGVYITLSKNNHGKEFETACYRIAAQIHSTVCEMGAVTGSDDYFLFAKDVQIGEFFELYKKIRGIGVGGDSPFDSTFTTLIFKSDSEFFKSNLGAYQQWSNTIYNEESENENISISDDVKLICDFINKSEKNALLIDLTCRLDEFRELHDSTYTEWVFYKYKPIVDLFTALIDEETDIQKKNDEAESFFRILSGMLESLLNTSAYFTNSPGYRRVDHNSIPRLIVTYQCILNGFIEEWDKYTREYEEKYLEIDEIPDRNHKILLSVRNNLSLDASMYLRNLPPDQRIISVRIPLFEAFQPLILIPKLIHEAGHYIGVRNRHGEGYTQEKSRFDYYLEIVLSNFIIEFMDLYYNKYYPTTEDETILEEYAEDGTILELFFAFIYRDLLGSVKEAYEKTKDSYLDRISKEVSAASRLSFSIKQDYFSQMMLLTKSVFCGVFRYDRTTFIGWFNNYIEIVRANSHATRDVYARVYNRLRGKFENVFQDIYEHFTANEIGFIEKAEDVLSEVAADVFMVQACGLSAEQYALLLFEDYKFTTLSNDLVKLIQNDINVVYRLVSLTYELGGISKTISRKEEKRLHEIAAILGDNANICEQYVCFKSFIAERIDELNNLELEDANDFEEWSKDLRKIRNPLWHVKQYTQSIFTDIRYDEEKSKRLTKMEKVREKMWQKITKLKKAYNDIDAAYEDDKLSEMFRKLSETDLEE